VKVQFRKGEGRRYYMRVTRERGPALAERQGPGYDDDLPHDLVHFVVEAEAGLTAGVFGQVAAGRNQIFWPEDKTKIRKQNRRDAKAQPLSGSGEDMRRSELLTTICTHLWQVRTGRRGRLPHGYEALAASESDAALIARIVNRLDERARAWRSLPPGGSRTLTWPDTPPPKRRSR